MGNPYTKLSFDKIRRKDSNTINYSIFSENVRLPIDLLFKEPFIVEGLVLGLCIKGSAKIKISFNEYELKPNTVFVLIPSQVVHLVENSLKNSLKTIVEISEELNFSSPSFFCRLFKKYARMSPMKYRK